MGLYRDDGKENGGHFLGLYRRQRLVYIGIMYAYSEILGTLPLSWKIKWRMTWKMKWYNFGCLLRPLGWGGLLSLAHCHFPVEIGRDSNI